MIKFQYSEYMFLQIIHVSIEIYWFGKSFKIMET